MQAPTRQSLDQPRKLSEREGLPQGVARQLLLGYERECALPVVRLDGDERFAVARRQDNPGRPRQVGQLVAQIDAIAIRKPNVNEHRVGPRVLDNFERLCGVRGSRDNLDSQVGQDPACQRIERRIVIDDQHRSCHPRIIAPLLRGEGRENRRLDGCFPTAASGCWRRRVGPEGMAQPAVVADSPPTACV
jgi:hypothetical protein